MTFGENFLTFFYAFDLNQRKSNNIPYRNSLPLDRVGGGFRRRPLTPPDMRFRIRRFS